MARLTPTPNTIKRLFAHSGNLCAFPGCNVRLFQNETLIGQVCHIEAAEEKGPRYNHAQSDEERRSYDNLILFCANHHLITHDPFYTPKDLQEMKQNHESRLIAVDKNIFDKAVKAIWKSVKPPIVIVPYPPIHAVVIVDAILRAVYASEIIYALSGEYCIKRKDNESPHKRLTVSNETVVIIESVESYRMGQHRAEGLFENLERLWFQQRYIAIEVIFVARDSKFRHNLKDEQPAALLNTAQIILDFNKSAGCSVAYLVIVIEGRDASVSIPISNDEYSALRMVNPFQYIDDLDSSRQKCYAYRHDPERFLLEHSDAI